MTFSESFNVDVKLTADPPDSPYASAQAELTYDSTLVTPDLTGLNNVSENDTESPGTLTITHGPGDENKVGDGGVTLASIPFTPIADGIAVFSVSDGATITLSGQSEDDEDISATSGDDLTVSVTAAQGTEPEPPEEPQIEFNQSYAGLPGGYQLLLYKLEAAPTKFYTYGENGGHMHYALIGGEHYLTYIVADTVTTDTAETPVLTETDYKNDGDVNGNDEIRVADAQIVYDLVNGHNNYNTLDGLGIQARLKADVDGDGVVNGADIKAILDIIHGA